MRQQYAKNLRGTQCCGQKIIKVRSDIAWKKTAIILAGAAFFVALSASSQAQDKAFEQQVSVGAVAATTGFGGDVSWRFHDKLALTARYTGGLDFNISIDEEDIDYDADFEMKASSLKVDYFPFGGSFFLSAGAMMSDIDANVTGTPQAGGVYTFNDQDYSAAEIGSVSGAAKITDGTQPYVGLGWRSSHESGFGFFSEFGVVATDVDVSLSTSRGFENIDQQLNDDIRGEEKSIEDDMEQLPVFPVALVGISYTF